MVYREASDGVIALDDKESVKRFLKSIRIHEPVGHRKQIVPNYYDVSALFQEAWEFGPSKWEWTPQPPAGISIAEYEKPPSYWIVKTLPSLGKVTKFDNVDYIMVNDLVLKHWDSCTLYLKLTTIATV